MILNLCEPKGKILRRSSRNMTCTSKAGCPAVVAEGSLVEGSLADGTGISVTAAAEASETDGPLGSAENILSDLESDTSLSDVDRYLTDVQVPLAMVPGEGRYLSASGIGGELPDQSANIPADLPVNSDNA